MVRGIHLASAVLGTFLLGLSVQTASGADDSQPDPKSAFERTAQRVGAEYVVGREYLAAQGENLLPLLRGKSRSDDWRERDLANALILRIEQPAKIKLWARLLQNWYQTFERREDGTVVVRFPEYMIERLPKEIPRDRDVVLTRECVPFVLDQMREIYRGSYQSTSQWTRCVQVMRHLADADSSHALATYLEQVYKADDPLKDVLLGIGKGAVPALRNTIRGAPQQLATDTTLTQNARAQRYFSTAAAANAAELLADLGDKGAVPLLIERLRVSDSDRAIPAYARALAKLGDKDAAAVVFDRLVDCVDVMLGSAADYDPPARYSEVRPALLAFGDRARELLAARIAEGHPIVERALATGLLYELDHPRQCATLYRDYGSLWAAADRGLGDGDPLVTGRDYFWAGSRYGESVMPFDIPLELAMERAAVFAAPSNLVQLTKETENELAFEIAAAGLLTNRYNDKGGPPVVTALAAAGQTKALKIYEQLLDERAPVRYRQSIVEAILLLGDPRGAPLLESVVDRWKNDRYYGPVAEIAKVVLPVVEGKQPVEKLLGHEQASVRLVAARRLVREQDLRGLPEVLAAARVARGRQHAELRDLIVGIGEKAIAPLTEQAAETEELYVKVLCDSLVVRIKQPELIERLARAAWIRTPGFGNIRGPGVADFQAAGAQVAELIGEEAIPVVDASLLFESNELAPGIAAFALAKFEQPRSIPVLVQALRNPTFARGQSVSAVVLGEFGEAGIEAAKKIPPPDPDKVNFAGRARRHRGGTRVLDMAGDKQSVENILAATKDLREVGEAVGDEDYGKWSSRMIQYLNLAATSDDRRLLEMAIRFLKHPEPGFAAPALNVLARYDDDRAVTLALNSLRTKGEYAEKAALPILVKQLNEKAAAMVLEQLKTAMSDSERLPLVRSIKLLVEGTSYWSNGADPNGMLSDARRVFQPALIEQLASDNAELEKIASLALASYESRNKESAAALANLVMTQTSPEYQVIDYLDQSRTDEAAAALLAAYRRGDRKNGRIAMALGRMQYVKALGDITQALDERLKDRHANYGGAELEALRSFGAVGVPKILETLRADTSLQLRVIAAEKILGHKEAFDDVCDLFLEITSQGLSHPDIVRHDEPRRYYETLIYQLSASFCSLDAPRAYPIMSSAVVRIKNDDLARPIAQRLAQFRQNYMTSYGIDLAMPEAEKK